jgi:c-di-GMP-binding flagellar brake protein YcgR
MEEHRRFVRLDTRLQVDYTVLPAEESQQAATKDISGSGICLFAREPLKPGEQLQVAMRLPGQEEAVNFTGEVVWCEQYEVIGKEERQRSVEVGLRFIEIAPKDQAAIMQHVILGFHPQRSAGP